MTLICHEIYVKLNFEYISKYILIFFDNFNDYLNCYIVPKNYNSVQNSNYKSRKNKITHFSIRNDKFLWVSR